MHQNINSLRNKLDSLEIFLMDEEIDVLCLTEHHLTEELSGYISLNGYKLSSMFCRILKSCGGSAIFCKESLINNVKELKKIKEMSTENIVEISAIEVYLTNKKLCIISVYRPPHGEISPFLKSLEIILNSVCRNANNEIIICGDLNIDNLGDATAKRELTDVLSSFNISKLINTETRVAKNSKTGIDYICVNNSGNVLKCNVIFNGLSDHSAQILTIGENINKPVLTQYARSFTEQNHHRFRSYLLKETWSEVFTCQEVNEAFSNFVETMKYYTDITFPLRKYKPNLHNNKKSWITPGIRTSSKHLKRIYCDLLDSNYDDNILNYYRNYKRIYSKVINEAKKRQNISIFQQTENKSKAAWKVISSNISHKSNKNRKVNKIRIENHTISETKDIVNYFNDYFVNIPVELNKKLPQTPTNCDLPSRLTHSMFLTPVDDKIVRDVLKNLKNSNSVGVDGINTEVLKRCADLIAHPLAYLINLMLDRGVFPEILKLAKIVPIYKKGDTEKVENFRPIALLSVISKIVERILFDKIISFLTSNNILHSAQHGFLKNRSTTTAIHDFLSKLYDSVGKNMKTLGIFMDLSKAFDLVNHELLLEKLIAYGLRGQVNNLLRSYLTNRAQVVEIDGVRSKEKNIEFGVPQGSVLGPLLFLLFVNDLPDIDERNSIEMFVDDISYLCSHKNKEELIMYAQKMLDGFVNWFKDNRLYLNIEKTVFINFTPRTKLSMESFLIKINSKSIQQVSETKFLGVWLENNLGWESHTSTVCNSLASSCYALYRLRELTNANILMTYYCSHFYSRIKYGIIFWGCSSLSLRVFKLQKRAVRIIAGVQRYTPCRNIFIEYRLLTVPCIYILETLVFVKSNLDKFQRNSDYHKYYTRHCEKFCIPRHNLSICEQNPAYFGILLYNKLPNSIGELKNISAFKKSVRNMLLDKCYYHVNDFLNDSEFN